MKSDDLVTLDPETQLTFYEQNTGGVIWLTHDNVITTCKMCIPPIISAFTV